MEEVLGRKETSSNKGKEKTRVRNVCIEAETHVSLKSHNETFQLIC